MAQFAKGYEDYLQCPLQVKNGKIVAVVIKTLCVLHVRLTDYKLFVLLVFFGLMSQKTKRKIRNSGVI